MEVSCAVHQQDDVCFGTATSAQDDKGHTCTSKNNSTLDEKESMEDQTVMNIDEILRDRGEWQEGLQTSTPTTTQRCRNKGRSTTYRIALSAIVENAMILGSLQQILTNLETTHIIRDGSAPGHKTFSKST